MDTGNDYMVLEDTETGTVPADSAQDMVLDPACTKETLAEQLQEMEKVMATLGLEQKPEEGVAASGAKPPSGFVQATDPALTKSPQNLETVKLALRLDKNTDTFSIEGWESLVPAMPSSTAKFFRDLTHGELRSAGRIPELYLDGIADC